MARELREVVFVDGVRTAFGKAGPNGLDPYASVAAAARQEVYFRVLGMLNLDDRDLHQMTNNMENTADG